MSFSLNFATLGRENCAKAFWKSGHLFSTTVQLSPAVKTDLVSRSKYSASSFGGFMLLGDMLPARWICDIYAPRFSLVKTSLLDTLGATYLVAAYYQVYNQVTLLASIDGYHEREPSQIRRARPV